MAALSAVATAEDNENAGKAFDYLIGRLKKMLAAKRTSPGDGLADALIALQDEGELSEDEVVQTLTLFWASGGHNPSYAVSAGIEYFARHPDVFETYRAEQDLRAAIINELFRLFPPELSIARYATEPLQIHDVEIKPGDRLKFILDSANRDPEVFPRPDKLDVARPPGAAQNVTFGLGPHACAGQVISRAEVEAAFNIFAERVERFELCGDVVMDNSDRSRAYVSLPVKIHLRK